MASRFREADLSRVRTVSMEERGGSVDVGRFSAPPAIGEGVDALLEAIPDLFAGSDFRRAVLSITGAARAGRPVLAMFGAHFVKCGLSMLLVDLMERGVVTAVATNGAGAIHDAEIGMWGRTSEDVAARLADGTFGMCRETAALMNGAAATGHARGLGLGESIGAALAGAGARHGSASIALRSHELGLPFTVHVALGTDIVHEHPSADGSAIGDTTLRDFRILTDVVCGIDGGAVLNLGSAVILPEVFLKALAVARNLGHAQGPFTALSLDMGDPYRARVNVVSRPTSQVGMGVAFRGHHELLFPLLWAGVVRALDRGAAPDSR